ncbi:MAG: hypothetical protein IJ506_00855 [Clostridia bacterium]|nr:hypothetical protein [Clostridia bacterium]
MRKNTRKMISLVLAALTASSLLTACSRDVGKKVDNSKAQLYIANEESGYGRTWLINIAKNFEEYYKDYDFGNGKIGVQVHLEHQLDEFGETVLTNTFKDLPYDIYYISGFAGTAFEKQGYVVDMTETVTEKIYDEDGNFAKDTGKPATQSIVDTLYDEDYIDVIYNYNYGTDQAAKYYRMPMVLAIGGIVYDADLFNENGYFVDAQGNFGATFADIESGNCSTGPDGVKGTYDDGFANTWNDFVDLMDYMVQSSGGSVVPFTWSGQMNYQRRIAFNSIWANYEGKNDYGLNFSFKGVDDELGPINQSNAYLLQQQEGKKAAIKAMYDIMSDSKYYSSDAFKNDHLEAEQEFVWSKNTDKRVAMLMEGGWWEEEAREVFDSMSDNPADAYGQRDFRLMPIPRFEGVEGIADQKNTTRVLSASTSQQFEWISAFGENTEIAKMFIQFSHSRSQLVEFTKNTGCLRPYDFAPTQEEYATFTKFTKSIYEYVYEDAKVEGCSGAEIVVTQPTAPARISNPTSFDTWIFEATVNGVNYKEAIDLFKGAPGTTVNEAFAAMQKSWPADKWGYQDY